MKKKNTENKLNIGFIYGFFFYFETAAMFLT